VLWRCGSSATSPEPNLARPETSAQALTFLSSFTRGFESASLRFHPSYRTNRVRLAHIAFGMSGVNLLLASANLVLAGVNAEKENQAEIKTCIDENTGSHLTCPPSV